MKKVLALALSVLSIGFVVSTGEAKAAGSSTGTTTAANLVEPQIRIRIGNQNRNRNRNRRIRTTTTTRIVGFGRNRFRETIQVTYLPNGRTQTRVISRQRVR